MSNFIFSRRALQAAIDRVASTLDGEPLAALVDRLNRPGAARLPAMWELVMLDGLSRAGDLRHEIALQNGRRPDFEMTLGNVSQSTLVIGDITAVSDAGLDAQNPVDILSDELTRLARKAGLDPNRFGYDVRGEQQGRLGLGRMKLNLPSRGALLAILQREVSPWMRTLAAQPDQAGQFAYNQDGVGFVLSYKPNQRYASGGYPSYTVAVSKTKNPLFSALKEKRDQLRGAPDDALRVIIACDGDCDILQQAPWSRPPATFTAREVVQDFLRQTEQVDAVLLVRLEQIHRQIGPRFDLRLASDWIAKPATPSGRRSAEALDAAAAAMQAAVKLLPKPVLTAQNAVIRCQHSRVGPDMIGGYSMGNGAISLSARALQRLLAGELTVEQFAEAHDWNNLRYGGNPFERAARQGKMIAAVDVEEAGDKDDDWLTFRLRWDPAAAPFKTPHADIGADLIGAPPKDDSV
ncbi:MAG: hypothetical protein ACYDD1_02395 [Caulobacteraceae bacterium]